VTHRAVRNQHRGVHAVGAAARENVGRVGLDGDAVAAVGRRAEEARRDFADPPRRRQPLQLRQRKPAAAVWSTVEGIGLDSSLEPEPRGGFRVHTWNFSITRLR
jgi:hypothetical protein